MDGWRLGKLSNSQPKWGPCAPSATGPAKILYFDQSRGSTGIHNCQNLSGWLLTTCAFYCVCYTWIRKGWQASEVIQTWELLVWVWIVSVLWETGECNSRWQNWGRTRSHMSSVWEASRHGSLCVDLLVWPSGMQKCWSLRPHYTWDGKESELSHSVGMFLCCMPAFGWLYVFHRECSPRRSPGPQLVRVHRRGESAATATSLPVWLRVLPGGSAHSLHTFGEYLIHICSQVPPRLENTVSPSGMVGDQC